MTRCSILSGLLCSLTACLTSPAEDGASFGERTAATLAPPTVIAAGQDTPAAVRADGSTAYWVNANDFGLEPGDVLATPKAGGGAVTLIEGKIPDISGLALDDARIYWGQGATVPGVGGIRSKAKLGGGAVQLVSHRRVFAIAVADQSIYFASPDHGGQILRVATTGGAISPLASHVGPGLDNIPVVAVAGDKVFFTQSTFDAACDGLVRYVPKTGGTVKNVAKYVCGLTGLAADAGAVYWTEWDEAAQVGRIMKQLAPYTGEPIVLDTVTVQPGPLALDLTSVYYATTGFADGAIAKVAKTGGPRTTLAAGQQLPFSISLDATHVYWTTALDGEVKRVLK